MSQSLYAARGGGISDSFLYVLEPTAIRLIGRTGLGITGLAFHPISGVLYAVTSSGSVDGPGLYTINPATGASTLVALFSTSSPTPDIAFDSAGVLYGWINSTKKIVTIDLTTAVRTVHGSAQASIQGGGIAVDSGGNAYTSFTGTADVPRLDALDLSTYVVTPGSLIAGTTANVAGFSFDADDVLWAVISDFGAPVNLYTVALDGTATLISGLLDYMDALAWGPAAAPIPPIENPIVLALYPDVDGGQAIGNLASDGSGDLETVWIFAGGGFSSDLNAQGYSPLRTKIIVQSDESEGTAWWIANPGGTGRVKLTDTLPDTNIPDGGGAYHSFGDLGFKYLSVSDQYRLLQRSNSPGDYLYADGTLTDDGVATGHGTRVSRSADAETSMMTDPGVYTSAVEIVGVGDFPAYDKDTFPYWYGYTDYSAPRPSPDGSRITFIHGGAQSASDYQLEFLLGFSGGTFTLTVGTIGNIATDFYTTAPIAWNATAHDIWLALIALPNVIDPDPTGPDRWAGGPMGTAWVQVRIGPPNLWMTVDNTNIIGFGAINADCLGTLQNAVQGSISSYICDRDGSGLTEIPLDARPSIGEYPWNPNGSAFYYLGYAADGTTPYCRFYSVDPDTLASTLVLDYTGTPGPIVGYGPLFNIPIISPDGDKMVYVLDNSTIGHRELRLANIDGSDDTLLFNQNYTEGAATHDQLVLSGGISWSWDGTTICVIDNRDASPVFLIDIATTDVTQIFDGIGWDDSDLLEYLNSPLPFSMESPPVGDGFDLSHVLFRVG